MTLLQAVGGMFQVHNTTAFPPQTITGMVIIWASTGRGYGPFLVAAIATL